MKVISVRENPEFCETAIQYLQKSWTEVYPVIYRDCIIHSLQSSSNLPQWYLLENEGEIIGCAGLITNDFISRMDLCPWLCALYIEPEHRGNAYGLLLINKAKEDTVDAGFSSLYLCTDHEGYYEKYGFTYIGQGYHPWEEESRIYGTPVARNHEPSNPVIYFEIPVTDLDRAIRFYSAVFNFDFEKDVIDDTEMALFPFIETHSGISGALAKGEIYKPTIDGTLIYFTTEDIDKTLGLALDLGGKILYPKTSNGDLGYVAEFQDSEGNRIALHMNAE